MSNFLTTDKALMLTVVINLSGHPILARHGLDFYNMIFHHDHERHMIRHLNIM